MNGIIARYGDAGNEALYLFETDDFRVQPGGSAYATIVGAAATTGPFQSVKGHANKARPVTEHLSGKRYFMFADRSLIPA